MTTLHVVLASDNAGKLKEFSAILSQAGVRMTPQNELGVKEADEPHGTFVENALAKAWHASNKTGMPALADDSGLCVAALSDAPGVYSARYAARAGRGQSDQANNAYLLEQLKDCTDRRASYVAVLVFVRFPNDPRPLIVEGTWQGEILREPRGEHGFGYDPCFWLPDLQRTAAELEPEVKNQHSHRGQALRALLQRLLTTQRVQP